MASEEQPNWAFWRPLSFWKVIGIFALTNLVMTAIVVVLREGLKLPVPIAAAGGAGAVVAMVIVNKLVQKARAAAPREPGNDRPPS